MQRPPFATPCSFLDFMQSTLSGLFTPVPINVLVVATELELAATAAAGKCDIVFSGFLEPVDAVSGCVVSPVVPPIAMLKDKVSFLKHKDFDDIYGSESMDAQ